ncbi:MAG: OmpH family outer membrane protein [Pacificimonas sp.]
MTKFKTLLASAAIAAASVSMAAPVHAQARSVAVISTDGAIQGSQAWQNAQTAIRTTYAAQIQQLQTRQTALQTELQALQTAYQTAAQAPNATQETVRPSATALQQKQQAAQQELGQLQAPVARSEGYVREQIAVHLDASAKAAMNAKGVDLAIRPEAVVVTTSDNANLTSAVIAELNKRVQNVGVTPPANWQPGQTIRAAQAQQQPAQ